MRGAGLNPPQVAGVVGTDLLNNRGCAQKWAPAAHTWDTRSAQTHFQVLRAHRDIDAARACKGSHWSFKCVSAVSNCASSFTLKSWTLLFLTINPLEVIYPLQCSPFQVMVSTRRSSGFGCEQLVLSRQSLLSMDCPRASDGFQMAGGLGTWQCHPMDP